MIRIQLNLMGLLQCDSTKREKIRMITSNCLYFFILLSFLLTTAWYFAFNARTHLEYAESSYFVVTSLLAVIIYLHMFHKRSEYKRLFEDLDALVEESEYKAFETHHSHIFSALFIS